eukprot:TRINITY_DN23273_c0_g1_i1.p1 TRINITY_DN23273_c0_g1~~TRINITY_DN23273_c0_g1_i1.p1  ORF type:complete len:513 (-),score=144.37 TRINITY_DN23273_c0_g1_i1:56-1594(-)
MTMTITTCRAPDVPAAAEACGGSEVVDEETYMQGFIRSQMLSILRPVAEHVHQLRSQQEMLGQQLMALDGRVDEVKAQQAESTQDALSVRCAISETHARMEKVQDSISLVQREQSALNADHKATKIALGKTMTSLNKSEASAATMQQQLQYMDKDLHALQMRMTESSRLFASLSDGLSETRESVEDLQSRHESLARECSDAGRGLTQTRRDLDNFLHNYEESENGGRAQINNLKDGLRAIEKRFADNVRDDSIQERALKALECRIVKIEASLGGHRNPDGGIGKIDKITTTLKTTAATLKEQLERVHKLEDEMRAINGRVTSEHEVVWNEFKDLDTRLSTTKAALDFLDARIEESQQRDEDRITKTEGEMERLVISQGKLEQSTDSALQEVFSLQRWQTDVTSKLQWSAHEIQNIREDMTRAGREFDESKKAMQGMREDISSANMRAAKEKIRTESVRKSLNGMSKGFEDTYRHVAVDDQGFFGFPGSQRSSLISALPVLGLGGPTSRNIAG